MAAVNAATLLILIAFDLWVVSSIQKHETAIVELLRLHPELLEEEEDGGN